MDLKKRKSRKTKPKRRLILVLVAVLLALAITGYSYRDYIFAAMNKNGVAEGELPPMDAEPGEVEEPDGEGDTLEPADPTDPGKPEENLPEEDLPPVPDPPPGQFLQIKDGDYLLALVTRYTTLGYYEPSDLRQIPAEKIHPEQRQWQYYLRAEALEHLLLMLEDARGAGMEIYVNSAYRSFKTQEQLFRDYASRYGEEKANTFSARPGQSEHQLGTAVDLNSPTSYMGSDFGSTPEGRWLAENAHRYGFALSYPEGATEITGYIYEPWHFRFIGVEAAAAWKESGMVLCEFLEKRCPQEFVD